MDKHDCLSKKTIISPHFFGLLTPTPFCLSPYFFEKNVWIRGYMYMYILNTNVGKADYIIVNFPVNCIYM